MKLLPSQRKFSVHRSVMHHFRVSFYSEPNRLGARVFSCNLPSAPACTVLFGYNVEGYTPSL